MAQRPTVRWNETAGRSMAWVRFPAGWRRKVERVEKADAQSDLDELLGLRAQSLDPGPRRTRKATFNEVIDAWFADGCLTVAPSKTSRHAPTKSPKTLANACRRSTGPAGSRPAGARPRPAGADVGGHRRRGLGVLPSRHPDRGSARRGSVSKPRLWCSSTNLGQISALGRYHPQVRPGVATLVGRQRDFEMAIDSAGFAHYEVLQPVTPILTDDQHVEALFWQ